jgi:ribose transport system substrate-binding protein
MTTTTTSRATMALVAATATALLSACAVTASGSTTKGADTEIAYLSASSANTWLAVSRDAMEAEAKKSRAKITEFDAKFQPGVATKQIQDVIAAKKYKGIIIATNDGTGAIPALQQAMDAGIKVVVLNQTIGPDLTTAEPQVPGISASVLAPPEGTGQRLGKLALKACAGKPSCSVVYMYGQKGTPYDNAVRQGFNEVIATQPGIKVIAEAEGGFLGTDQPRKATQDVLQAHPNFDVLIGAGDQQIRGALLALKDAGKTSVKTIGVGASEPALAAIKDGTWFGDVAGVPADEGSAAFKALMAAIKDGKSSGGIDVVSQLPDGGLVTRENIGKFTAQWAG